jgi:hypothetical protein
MFEEQTDSEAERQAITQKHSLKIRLLAFLLTVVVLTIAILVALSLELSGGAYLQWAAKHPVLSAKYDPHHWVGRIAALAILFSIGRAIVSVVRQPWATFRAWQRVFLPLPWENREARGQEAERPAN